jgi:hypothetical protein
MRCPNRLPVRRCSGPTRGTILYEVGTRSPEPPLHYAPTLWPGPHAFPGGSPSALDPDLLDPQPPVSPPGSCIQASVTRAARRSRVRSLSCSLGGSKSFQPPVVLHRKASRATLLLLAKRGVIMPPWTLSPGQRLPREAEEIGVSANRNSRCAPCFADYGGRFHHGRSVVS